MLHLGNVVEAHHGEIAPYLQASFLSRTDHPQRGQVIGGQHSGRGGR